MNSPPRPQDETPAKAKPARLRLYNTLTRRKEDFAPIDPNAVRLYVCGPTVYDFAHIGNARPVIVFDVLFRLLRHVYGADHVTYVRNITDVEDKINARAARDYPGLPLNDAIAKVTEATERQFHEDVAALGALPPTHRAARHRIYRHDAGDDRAARRPRRRLCRRGSRAVLAQRDGCAALGAALRDARSPLARRDAGRRARRRRALQARSDGLRLMEAIEAQRAGWPSPAGIAAPGRPGWHIECSAMSMATLLEPFGGGLQCDDPSRNIFDIHGGGIDLVFPHHENEIAQSCSAFHSSRMANVWMHNGFLQVEGEKMSKSLGNFVTIHELLRTGTVRSETWPGEVLRLAMLRTHYHDPIDWTVKELVRADRELREWYQQLDGKNCPSGTIDAGVLDALSTISIRMMRSPDCKSWRRQVTGALCALRSVFSASAAIIAKLAYDAFAPVESGRQSLTLAVNLLATCQRCAGSRGVSRRNERNHTDDQLKRASTI